MLSYLGAHTNLIQADVIPELRDSHNLWSSLDSTNVLSTNTQEGYRSPGTACGCQLAIAIFSLDRSILMGYTGASVW